MFYIGIALVKLESDQLVSHDYDTHYAKPFDFYFVRSHFKPS